MPGCVWIVVPTYCEADNLAALVGGLAGAYRDGFAHALAHDATAVVQMDADGSHAPADVPRLLAALAGGADLAVRTDRGGSRLARPGAPAPAHYTL